MIWTKKHSQNAVAAKFRKRMRATEDFADEISEKIFIPHRSKPDFIVRIESKFGERMQISVNRILGKIRISNGQSARQFCRGLEHLLTKSA